MINSTISHKKYQTYFLHSPHICNRKFSISLFIVSGSSVLELCPAPLIHSRGIPVFLCHALLYLIHEPALSWSPQISSAGHLISYGRFFSIASARIRKPCHDNFAYLPWSPSYSIIISSISFLPYSEVATPFVPDLRSDFHG